MPAVRISEKARYFLRKGTILLLQSLLTLVIGAAFAVSLPAVAWAQSGRAAAPDQPPGVPGFEPPPVGSEMSLAQAKAAQAKAAQLFRENKFIEAAELLRLSYLGDRRPILLFNAGQAYRKAESALEAKHLYEEFLSAAPEHPLAPETRGYLKDMESLLATQDRAKQVALALEEQLVATKTSEQQAARELEKERLRSLQTSQQLLQTQAQLARERNKPVYRRAWFWVVMTGLAAGVLTAGAASGYMGSRARTEGGTVMIEN